MNHLIFLLINGPLVFLNALANAFYVFCIGCPLNGKRIKQPLQLLLGTLIGCSITYLMSFLVMVFFHQAESWKVSWISYVVALCSLSNSITSSVWLNFFYYTQIVPAQSALSIWIKNNVKSFIYCFWLVERIYTVFDFTTLYLSLPFYRFGSSNSTMDHDTVVSSLKWLKYVFLIVVWILKIHLFFCLCVMVMSILCTIVYLCGHMRRMVANGQPVSHPRLRSQVRVTVTGILQGVLYLICSVWAICQFFPFVFIDPTTHFTVINLYMSGTTVALGVGQAVFRRRAADIWLRAARCCREQQTEQGG
ncbi:Taste receptor type 2 member 107 [Dissostichus eleginoides]|uniref:Taste receptor type 2 n=1 Tax=Dissostichus eleginoides TaxID=100907 RepID=A0AAD9CK21_DISEL|nr:Taste receptor type 2 member 107 [Dissostichus eleginoides]